MIKYANDSETIEKLQQENAFLSSKKTELENKLAAMEQDHAELTAKYEWLLEKYRLKAQKLFGRSREITDGQMVLEGVFDEAEATAEPGAPEPSIDEETKTVTYAKKKYPGQKADKIASLPVERAEYQLPQEERVCDNCGKELPELAPVITRRIEVIPAQVKVIENVRHVYGPCPCTEDVDESANIINAPMPEPALPHSIATESAIAFVMTQKFQFGIPLYRQEQQWKMLDVAISRQTMANWVIAASDTWLSLLYHRMHQLLLERDIVHADETTLQVLQEPGRQATSKSYMWLFRSGRDGPPIVLFNYQTTRAAKHPETFLKGFAGFLCTDGYAAYYRLPSVIHVACWSHARRKFDDTIKAMPKTPADQPCAAKEGFAFCNQLFAIERDLRDAAPNERFAARTEKSQPLLDSFKAWLDYQRPRVTKKSHLGIAVNYCLNLWDELCNFMKDGRLEIDNNRSERSIKMFVIGRKGWLFANTPKGAAASAITYSLIETAKENGLKPFEYLVHILKTMPNSTVKDQKILDSLLPWSDSIPDSCKQRPF